MENFNPSGFTNDTIKQINNFNRKLNELGTTIPIDIRLEYIEHGKKRDDVSDEIYAQLDELKSYEATAILNELTTIKLQAQKSGVKIPEVVEKLKETKKLGNVPLVMEFSPKALEKIPQLRLFSAFKWLTTKELEQAKESNLETNSPNIENDDSLSL